MIHIDPPYNTMTSSMKMTLPWDCDDFLLQSGQLLGINGEWYGG